MNKINDSNKKRINTIIRIILIIIIIILLIHNCTLIKKNNEYKRNSTPGGNIDIIEIECKDNQCKKITSLSFADESISIRKGNTQKLIVIIKPCTVSATNLTWKSSDENIATVNSNGEVTGVNEGTTTITVSGPNGVSANITVKVVLETVKVTKINLNAKSITLKVGGSDQLIATIAPENATERELVWSSSDSSIVSVDENGIFKALKPGKVTITVKTKDGKVSSTCVITVEPIKVDSIELNPTHMDLIAEGSGQIVAIVKPDNATYKDIVWTTSDANVATVDNTGKVTGVSKGKATITAKSQDGKVKATCIVTVTNKVIDVERIILDMEDTIINTGTFEQVIATLKPDNATERELVWSSSDENIATVDDTGKVTGVSPGTVTITAKTKDGKVSSTITVTVKDSNLNGDVETYDEEKDPITWNGADDLKIFTNSIYNLDGFLAPESENTYQFVVRNNTKYKIKYNIDFVETNKNNINMQYKLKKNDTYIISNYTRSNNLNVPEFTLKSGESDTYYLDWKWISSSNDTEIGSDLDAIYKLQIEVKAESING